MSRLHTGRGNLVRRADEIRKLGAKAAKRLPATLLEITDDEPVDASDDTGPDTDADADLGAEAAAPAAEPDTAPDQPLRH